MNQNELREQAAEHFWKQIETTMLDAVSGRSPGQKKRHELPLTNFMTRETFRRVKGELHDDALRYAGTRSELLLDKVMESFVKHQAAVKRELAAGTLVPDTGDASVIADSREFFKEYDVEADIAATQELSVNFLAQTFKLERALREACEKGDLDRAWQVFQTMEMLAGDETPESRQVELFNIRIELAAARGDVETFLQAYLSIPSDAVIIAGAVPELFRVLIASAFVKGFHYFGTRPLTPSEGEAINELFLNTLVEFTLEAIGDSSELTPANLEKVIREAGGRVLNRLALHPSITGAKIEWRETGRQATA